MLSGTEDSLYSYPLNVLAWSLEYFTCVFYDSR